VWPCPVCREVLRPEKSRPQQTLVHSMVTTIDMAWSQVDAEGRVDKVVDESVIVPPVELETTSAACILCGILHCLETHLFGGKMKETF